MDRIYLNTPATIIGSDQNMLSFITRAPSVSTPTPSSLPSMTPDLGCPPAAPALLRAAVAFKVTELQLTVTVVPPPAPVVQEVGTIGQIFDQVAVVDWIDGANH